MNQNDRRMEVSRIMRVSNFLSPELMAQMKKREVGRPGYRVYDTYINPQGMPAIIQMSDSSEPPHWHIQDGMCSLFFLSYQEVTDYIRRRNLVRDNIHSSL